MDVLSWMSGVSEGQGALWPINIQLGLNIESALHHCIFNFCFSKMKLYEERACLFSIFLDSKIGNAEPAFSINAVPNSNVKIEPAFSIFKIQEIGNAETAFSIFKL